MDKGPEVNIFVQVRSLSELHQIESTPQFPYQAKHVSSDEISVSAETVAVNSDHVIPMSVMVYSGREGNLAGG